VPERAAKRGLPSHDDADTGLAGQHGVPPVAGAGHQHRRRRPLGDDLAHADLGDLQQGHRRAQRQQLAVGSGLPDRGRRVRQFAAEGSVRHLLVTVVADRAE